MERTKVLSRSQLVPTTKQQDASLPGGCRSLASWTWHVTQEQGDWRERTEEATVMCFCPLSCSHNAFEKLQGGKG